MGDFGFNPFSFGDISDILSGIVGAILDALTYLFNLLVAIAQFLYNLLVILANAIVAFLRAAEALMVHLFETLYTDVIKPILDEIAKIEAWLNKVLSPVVRFLKQIQAWYNKYVLPWQKLADQIISKIRQFLAIFRLFGAKWAQKLDADLAQVQSYINTSILAVVTTLNGLIGWVQLVTDPTQILRKAFWQNTAFTGVSEIFKAANLGGMKPLSKADTAQGQANLGLLNPASPPVTAGAGGAATFSPTMQDVQTKMLAAVPDYNPTAKGYTGPVQA